MNEIKKTALFAFLAAEAVLYALFLRLDFFGGSATRSAMYKYAGILLCLVCASVRAVTLKNTASRLIAAALFFTCISDYFLLFTDSYLPGVLCFCVTQTLYLFVLLQGKPLKAKLWHIVPGLALSAAVLIITCLMGEPDLLIAAGVFYAYSFVRNIVLALSLCLKKKTVPGLKTPVFAVGLIIFALCDINVLLYNLPLLFDIHSHLLISLFDVIGTLMWVFYLPSQVLLALSAKNSLTDNRDICRI